LARRSDADVHSGSAQAVDRAASVLVMSRRWLRARLWGWWGIGVILLVIDVLRLIPLESIRVDVLTATIYAAAMGFTMAVSLNADPFTLFSSARRVALPKDWMRVRAIVPLVVGVLPVLLLTLGIEFNYFRRTLADAGQRAATAATVTVMAAGLVGALSTLPWDGQGCGDVLSGWHEYMAFLLSVQAIFTGLVTLVWLLAASTPDDVTDSDTLSKSG
jgi:hypothetical protein